MIVKSTFLRINRFFLFKLRIRFTFLKYRFVVPGFGVEIKFVIEEHVW